MRIVFWIFLALTLTAGSVLAFGSDEAETPHLVFVTEYMRELAAIEHIRASAEKDAEHGKVQEKLLSAIHASTLFQLELRSQIGTLKGMHLNAAEYEQVIPGLIDIYAIKIGYYQRVIDISTNFLAGPKPGIDYGKMLAEMPQIRAELEDIDHTLFNPISPLIFSTLIDRKPDSKNHVSHLIITRAERTTLIEDINSRFGAKLDQKDQNSGVSAAQVLKTFLIDLKCSDEPWD